MYDGPEIIGLSYFVPPGCEWDDDLYQNYSESHRLEASLDAHNRLEYYELFFDKIFAELPITDYYYLLFLAINPKYQGQGYGSDMLDFCINLASKESVIIDVSDEALVKYYIKFGFRVCSSRKLLPDITSNLTTIILRLN